MAKAYEDYDFNSRNSYKTTPASFLQELASVYYAMSRQDEIVGDLEVMVISARLRESLYRAARIRMGIVESDYDFG